MIIGRGFQGWVPSNSSVTFTHISNFSPNLSLELTMSFAHANFLANQTLYINQDIKYQSTRKERSDLYITHQDWVHHQQMFVLGQYPITLTPYPTNIAIQRHSGFNRAQNKGVHDLQGSNSIWALAIISDVAQKCCGEYPRKGVLQGVSSPYWMSLL